MFEVKSYSALRSNPLFIYYCVFLASIALYSGCITPKDTVSSRGMQNLTARYNIIYNANLLLEESSNVLENASIDNYNQLLPIYKEPIEGFSAAEGTILDSIIKKANTIIDEKVNSSYVDDAYLLIGKANYLKSEFFNASEYFSYVYNNYPSEKDARQTSLVWKTRALLQLQDLKEAGNVIDTALKYVETSKVNRADVYATYAQFLIDTRKNTEAIAFLEKATEFAGKKRQQIRWKYILGQLQVEDHRYEEAYKNFSAVVKSNASFEMAFNANINRIKIEEELSGESTDRITRLRSLLKDDKNKDFTDQIYFHIGNILMERNSPDEAILNYNKSITNSTRNLDQKGLSYLKLADIYFDNADYVRAKAYYDSTLSTLSPQYPGLALIRKKSSNLDLLATKYRIISREDTLQVLAQLSEAEREERIGELVRQQANNALNLQSEIQSANSLLAGIDRPSGKQPTEGKFYFNNSAALSQGFSDFKRKWGNRRLEDNWRRATKTAAETTLSMSTDPDAPIGASLGANINSRTAESIRQDYLKDLPLTEPLLQQSNQKIAEAFYDIANFYKDELKDDNIAIKTYEELLERTPHSSYSLPVYYNLYRLYQPLNMEKSTYYKNLILSNHPESPFAKAIKDPNYSREADEKERALNEKYDEIFKLYTDRKYDQVMPAIQQLEQTYGNTKLSPQLAYLNALAVGHTRKLAAFENVLEQLVAAFPNDQLITPLARQHLTYIQEHRDQLAIRSTALTEIDPNHRPFFIEEPVMQAQSPAAPAQLPTQKQKETTLKTPDSEQTLTESTVKASAEVSASPFSLPGAAEYYFVVNITEPRYNLSSSRFGIGQFNRTHYAGVPLKHQLQDAANENELIYVGPFMAYEDVKAYETSISPLLKDIMKVPAAHYTTFVITKDGLAKLKNRQIINSYIEFYKNSN